MRRRGALAFIVILGGAALAAPLPVLEVDADGGRAVPVGPSGEFRYTYRQSIFDAPVDERFRIQDGRLRQLEVRSPSRQALEYFGWTAEVREAAGWLSMQAPGGVEERLTIRIAAGAGQRLEGARALALDALRADVVGVTAGRRPAVVWAALLARGDETRR